MDIKPKIISFTKLVFMMFIFILLNGCYLNDSFAQTVIQKRTNHKFLLPTSFSQLAGRSLTAERIINQADCESQDDLQGYILFTVNESKTRTLFMADGNGCNKKMILENAAGAPDWSQDGTKITIGCEAGTYICILDGCSSEKAEGCNPIIESKIEVLPEIVEQNRAFGNLSWSASGNSLLVETLAGTYLLDLTTNTWDIIFSGGGLNTQLSPIDDKILISEDFSIKEIYLNKLFIDNLATGGNAVYSSDGQKITFIGRGGENMEPYGIMEYDPTTLPIIDVVYWPLMVDQTWDSNNVIKLFPQHEQSLSWSPDDRYLVFIEGRYSNRILRLDRLNGEVVDLTGNMGFEQRVWFTSLSWGGAAD